MVCSWNWEGVNLDLNQKFNKSIVFFYGSDSGVIPQLCNLVLIWKELLLGRVNSAGDQELKSKNGL